MQDTHNGDDHHPAGLIRLAAVAAALVAAPAAHAAEPRFVALPSPLTPLTASPPIGGGATAAGEGHPHRVISTLTVGVSIDSTGSPFALRATQRLDVRRIGDYFFTIGAPISRLATAAGSTPTPGYGPAPTSGKGSIRAAASSPRRSSWNCRGRGTAAAHRDRRRPRSLDQRDRSPGRRVRGRREPGPAARLSRRAARRGGAWPAGDRRRHERHLHAAARANADLGAARDRRDDRRKARTADARRQRTTREREHPTGSVRLTVRPLLRSSCSTRPPANRVARSSHARPAPRSNRRVRGSTTRSSATPTRPGRAVRRTTT